MALEPESTSRWPTLPYINCNTLTLVIGCEWLFARSSLPMSGPISRLHHGAYTESNP